MNSPATPAAALEKIQRQRKRDARIQDTVRQLCRSWVAEYHPRQYSRLHSRAKEIVSLEHDVA